MQSFLTIFVAGSAAFLAAFMLNPEVTTPPEPAPVALATFEAEPVSHVPLVVIDPQQPLVLALDAAGSFEGAFDLPVDALVSFSE